jgi:hypothetical protein
MRTPFIKILIVIAVILIILIISTQVVVQRVIRRQFTAFIKESCGSCTLSLDRVRLSVVPFSVILEGVRLAGGDPKTTRVDAEAERIVARSTLRSLVSGKLHFEGIEIHAPYVVVTEGDLPSPPPGPEEGTRRIYVINGMQVVNGRFTYMRVFGVGKEARRAILHVKDIQGNMGKLGNTSQLRGQVVRGQAKGRLEDSGEFLLAVETVLVSKVLQVDVDLQMVEQNLADISPFFQTSDGIRIRGKLNKGQSSTKIRGEELTGWVQAQYRGLDVQFEKTESRGEISTFFDNLVKSMKLHSSTVGKKPADQIRSVQLQREERETLLHFILRGMKDAALKVAGNP